MMTVSQFADHIGRVAVEELKLVFASQGYRFTGELIRSVEHVVRKTMEAVDVSILFNFYGRFLVEGVPANRIRSPFAPPRIRALTAWSEKKFSVSRKEAERIAYAIARKHSQLGFPLPMSGRKRTGAVEMVIEKITPDIEAFVASYVTERINAEVANALTSQIPGR